MDTTKTYIKMSDHPLIQKRFPNNCGDIICGWGVGMGYNYGPISDGKEEKPKFIKPFPMLCELEKHEGHWYHTVAEYSDGWGGCQYFDNIIWLPRQDDIQKLVNGSWVIAFEAFNEWYFNTSYPNKTYPNDVFISMEQMWLAFYMHEKHNLIWENGEWRKQ